MVAPASDPSATVASIPFPAVAHPFYGTTASNQDGWYDPQHFERLLNEVFAKIVRPSDVFYGHMPISGEMGLAVKDDKGVPLLYIPHALEILSLAMFGERAPRPLRILSEFRIADRADAIITNTEWERRFLADMYSRLPTAEDLLAINSNIPSDNLRIFVKSMEEVQGEINSGRIRLRSSEELLAKTHANPLGVDVEYFSPELRAANRALLRDHFLDQHNIPKNDPVLIGSLGRIHPQKDPIAGLRIFQMTWRALNCPENLYCVLAGTFPIGTANEPVGYYAEVLEHLTPTGRFADIRDRVIFTGTGRPEEINAILDVRIDTSRFETWGISKHEALGMGLPSVALFNAVYQEIWGEQGIRLARSDEEMRDELIRLITDKQAAQEYGAVCQQAAATYYFQRSVDGLLKVANHFGFRSA